MSDVPIIAPCPTCGTPVEAVGADESHRESVERLIANLDTELAGFDEPVTIAALEYHLADIRAGGRR